MSLITDISQLNFENNYSYADYLTWKFEQSVELIKGRIFKMSPATKTRHQQVSRNLSGIFYNLSDDILKSIILHDLNISLNEIFPLEDHEQ